MDKTESPTPQRLRDLREEGITAFSRPSQYAIATGVVVVYFYLNRAGLSRLFTDLIALPAQSSRSHVLEQLGLIAQQGLELLLFVLVTQVIMQSLWGLLQTRALIQPSLLSIDFGRLGNHFGISLGEIFSRMVKNALCFVLFFVLLILLLIMALWSIPTLMSYSPEEARGIFEGGLSTILIGWALLACALAVVTLMVEKVLFLRRHRMSRREIEEEGGEE